MLIVECRRGMDANESVVTNNMPVFRSTKSGTYAVHKASKTTEEDDTIKEHPLEVCAYESINEVPRVREQNTPEKTVYHV